jgi:hypothetical protein
VPVLSSQRPRAWLFFPPCLFVWICGSSIVSPFASWRLNKKSRFGRFFYLFKTLSPYLPPAGGAGSPAAGAATAVAPREHPPAALREELGDLARGVLALAFAAGDGSVGLLDRAQRFELSLAVLAVVLVNRHRYFTFLYPDSNPFCRAG